MRKIAVKLAKTIILGILLPILCLQTANADQKKVPKKKMIEKITDEDIVRKADEAIIAYNEGNYNLALKLASPLENKNPVADFTLGMLYSKGYAVQKNLSRGNALLNNSCTNGYPAACHNLGVRYHRGEGVQRSVVEAVRLYLRACELGRTESCYDEGGRQYQIGPLLGGYYTNVHIVSDSVGVSSSYGRVTMLNSVIEAPVCIRASGYNGIDVRNNDFACDLAIEFTDSILIGNTAINNNVRGRLSNNPNF